MNKKISTIFAAGLLMVGALFSNANAQTTAVAVDLTKPGELAPYYYVGNATAFLKANAVVNTTTDNKDKEFIAVTGTAAASIPVGEENLSLFKVTPMLDGAGKVAWFKLTSKETGADVVFAFNSNDAASPAAADAKAIVAAYSSAIGGVPADGKIPAAGIEFVPYSGAAPANAKVLALAAGAVTYVDAATNNLIFYAVDDTEIGADKLNTIRGSFSFKATGMKDQIFAKNIKAFDVATAITTGFSGLNQSIPAGTYFATSWGDLTGDAIASYEDFAKCTFIAIDPNTTLGDKPADDLKAGKNMGFKEVVGSNFNFFTAAATAEQKSKNSEVSVINAGFVVNTNSAQSNADGIFSYAISTKAPFRYQADAAKPVQTAGTKASAISVVEITKVKQLVATKDADAKSYIFTFGPNPISKVTNLLNATGASIYNIRFESGKVETEKGKYMGAGVATGTTFSWVAQGTAVAELDAPLYQFVISAVDTTKNQVTFTNREASTSFTCELDTTATTGIYKVVAAAGVNYQLVTVDNEGAYTYETAVALLGKTISLHAATVNKFNGFAVRGGVKDYVRLSFGKDATAAMLYAKVTGSAISLSDKEAEAAVFELISTKNGNDNKDLQLLRHDYVMLDSKGAVKTMSLKDTVAFYQYNVKLVEETGAHYLVNTDASLANNPTLGSTHKFIIKENKDGSISLMAKIGGDAKSVSAKSTGDGIEIASTPYTNADAETVKLFLTEETYGASLPAEKSHIAMQVATVTNGYVGVSAKNEGVVLTKTAADAAVTLYLDTVAVNEALPSFYISQGVKDATNRLFMYNAADSATFVGGADSENPYKWATGVNKVIFKPATLVSSDTLKTTVKGKEVNVAKDASTDGTVGGLDNFRFQIYKANDSEDTYVVRCGAKGYLANVNGHLTLKTSLADAMKVFVEAQDAPTSNEGTPSVSAVSVIASEGQITIAGADGKRVAISNILGQIIANQVITSSDATISVPAGIVVVAIEGEEAVKAIVK